MQCCKPLFSLREFKLEVTYRCSLNCIHCSSDARPSNLLEVSIADCRRILSEAATIGAKDVAFSGGEPLLWPYIYDAVEYACKYQLNVAIYTSGNVEDFKNKAKCLHKFGTSKFIFSIFGADEMTHDRITRKAGSFEQTDAAIQDAIAVGLTTEIHFVPMSSNYRELSDVVVLAHRLGVSRVSILRLVPQGRAALIRNRTLNRNQNLELRRQIQDLRKDYGYDFVRVGSPYNFLGLNDKPVCLAAIDRLSISPDLRIYPCDAFKRIGASELVGTGKWSSLMESSLSDCWDKSPYLQAIRTYLTTDFAEPCKSCKLLGRCMSGCLAQKVIAYGTLDKIPDPDCLHLKGGDA